VSDLPTRHDEAWRWADLRIAERMLNANRDAHAPGETAPPANDTLPEIDQHWLDIPGLRHLTVAGHPVGTTTLDTTAAPDRTLPRHPLADLAAASARHGATIHLSADEDGGTIQLLHVGTAGAAHSVTRVELSANARLTIIETFADERRDHWLNHRFDAFLAEGAELTRIVRVRTAHGLVSERGAVSLGANARFTSLTLASAGSALRSEAHVTLDGAGAHAEVNGILLGDGHAALDALTRLEHRVPDTSSGQTFRLVAAGQSQVSIAGGISVARHAQKTDAAQSLKALVLKRTAAANLKPELEIYADDVKCAHGCTVGELDRNALFYLQSRGLPRLQAQALLTQAFVADALSAIREEPLHSALDREARAWLEART
jgi:Fe-S cluster assembly protein SufD